MEDPQPFVVLDPLTTPHLLPQFSTVEARAPTDVEVEVLDTRLPSYPCRSGPTNRTRLLGPGRTVEGRPLGPRVRKTREDVVGGSFPPSGRGTVHRGVGRGTVGRNSPPSVRDRLTEQWNPCRLTLCYNAYPTPRHESYLWWWWSCSLAGPSPRARFTFSYAFGTTSMCQCPSYNGHPLPPSRYPVDSTSCRRVGGRGWADRSPRPTT